jgi:hypothetical protein
MEIIHFFKCANHYEARQTEQVYFKLLNTTLNSIEPVPEPKIKNVKIKNKQPVYCKNISTIKTKPKQSKTFRCELCDFKCYQKCDWDKHIKRKKHVTNTEGNKKLEKSFLCGCGKFFQTNAGLWKHKSKGGCVKHNIKSEPPLKEEIIKTEDLRLQEITKKEDLIIMLLKQNADLMELVKKMH